MSTIRPTGPGPSMLRINGQEITTRPTVPVQAPEPAGGAPASQRPIPGKGDTSALQEQMYDAAHMASIRGEQASAMIAGKRRSQKRSVKKKGMLDELLGDNARVEGVFPDGDPSNRQEEAFQSAAEFEERVKDTDLSFKRKAAQVEVSNEIFQIDLDDGDGALVMGESTAEIDLTRFAFGPPPRRADDEITAAGGRPKPLAMDTEDTIPNVEVSISETGLRRALGLGKK